MERFRDAKQAALIAIPIGAVGGFVAVLGFTADITIAKILGVLLVMVSGGVWTLHGIAEDSD